MIALNSVLEVTENLNQRANSTYDLVDIYDRFGLTSARLKDTNMSLSVKEWLAVSGLDWDVDEAPVQYTTPLGQLVTSPEEKVVYRSDSKNVLGIFKNNYRSIQNEEILNFFGEYCSEIGANITQVGYADDGKKVYAYADLEAEVKLVGSDIGSKKLLLIDSRDGSLGLTKIPFFERLICFNQLSAANRKFGKSSHRHSKNFSFEDVARDLEIYNKSFDGMFTNLNDMANARITSGQALTAIYRIHAGEDKPENIGTATLNKIISMHNKFNGAGIGSNMEETKGTLYGVLNAITEYHDHDAGRNDNSRWKSKTYGAGSTKKTEAYNCLSEVLGITEELDDIQDEILSESFRRARG